MSENFDVKVELLSSPGELPIRVRAADGTSAMIVRIGVGAMIAIAGFFAWTGAMPLDRALGPAMASNIALAVIALGGLYVLRGLFSRGRGHEFCISTNAVEKTAGPGGKWKGGGWKEPLSSYRGVRWRRMNLAQWGTRGRVRQVHVVELVHPDPARTVPLFARTSGRANARDTFRLVRDAFAASRSGKGDEVALRAEGLRLARQATGSDVRNVWEGLAALLRMPAIDARGNGEETRDAADLDKSINELAAEGKVAKVWDDKPAPSGLEVKKLGSVGDPEALEVRILKSVVPPLIRPLFYAFGTLGLLFVLTGQIAGGLLTAVVFLGAPSLFERLEVKNPRTLWITRQEIAYRDPNRAHRRDFAIPLSSIEHVHTELRTDVSARNVPERFIGRELVVSTDELEYRFGKGLDDQALEWLREYIVSAMAHA